ncbi:hypothetical protein ILUMI_24219, partial [Ignelater luminosus]
YVSIDQTELVIVIFVAADHLLLQKYYSRLLEEELAMIEKEDQKVNCIYTQFPDSNVLTYEDSGDEDDVRYIDNLIGEQYEQGREIFWETRLQTYAIWIVGLVSCYLINFDVHQGKNPKVNNKYENEFGKCFAPLVQSCEGTGTPGNNRLTPNCPIIDNRLLEKKSVDDHTIINWTENNSCKMG